MLQKALIDLLFATLDILLHSHVKRELSTYCFLLHVQQKLKIQATPAALFQTLFPVLDSV